MAAGGGALTVDVEHTGYPIGIRTTPEDGPAGDENLAVVFDAADTYSQIAIRSCWRKLPGCTRTAPPPTWCR